MTDSRIARSLLNRKDGVFHDDLDGLLDRLRAGRRRFFDSGEKFVDELARVLGNIRAHLRACGTELSLELDFCFATGETDLQFADAAYFYVFFHVFKFLSQFEPQV